MAKLLVSACLLGCRCRYKGDGCKCDALVELAKRHTLIPVCPEQLGGLATPRPPAERMGERVMTRNGGDVTAAYASGAEEALRFAKLLGCKKALLKARSPSCGHGQIYDGSFTGTLISGNGVAAQLLEDSGMEILDESQWEDLL